MAKKKLIEKIENYKPKYIYQRYNGEIRQYEVVKDNYLVDTKTGMSFDFKSHLMLGKSSENINDLIEANDYVNGRLVLQVDYKNKNICLLIPLTDTKANTNIMWYGYEDIKSIVTHEQFKSIEYTIHEREEKENE